ncbi:hypothetical protein [Streptomyces sp. ISL-44]|nr:hypothetical protein [Streptomyces sp. ISL-44]
MSTTHGTRQRKITQEEAKHVQHPFEHFETADSNPGAAPSYS